MLRAFTSRLSYSNVVATLALFIALGGVGYAAATLPENSVGAPQLKKNAVTGSKVRNSSLTGSDVKDRSLSAKDFRGSVQGPKGDPGPSTGPAGGALSGSYPNPALAAGAVTVDKLAPLATVRVTNADPVSVTTNADTVLPWSTELYDVGGMHSDAQSSRLTAPAAGVYAISAGVRWGSNDSANRMLSLLLNDTTIIASDTRGPMLGGVRPMNQVATTRRLAAGDFITVTVLQNSGLTLQTQNFQEQTHATMTLLGP